MGVCGLKNKLKDLVIESSSMNKNSLTESVSANDKGQSDFHHPALNKSLEESSSLLSNLSKEIANPTFPELLKKLSDPPVDSKRSLSSCRLSKKVVAANDKDNTDTFLDI